MDQPLQKTQWPEHLYETVLSNTPDLVYIFNLQHRFTYANKALLSMWGKTAEESLGKNCLELGYEPWHAAMHDREIEQVVATKKSIRGEVAFNGTNGRRWYDYIFVPVIGADGTVEAIAGTTRDVTDQRKQRESVKFLSDLAASLAGATDEQEIIRIAASALGMKLNAHRCYFVECQEEEDLVRCSLNWVRDHAPSIQGNYGLFNFGGLEWWRQYSRGDFTVNDTENNPLIGKNEAANYASLGIKSYAVQPVKRSGTWTVVLAVTDNIPREWTSDDLRLLENVGARVWPMIERARTEVALRQARDEALAASRAKDEFLAALSHELRTPLNPVLLLASEGARNPAVPEAIREDFAAITRGISMEARLIDDLLDLTRIEHDKLSFDFKVHDIHTLLDSSLAAISADGERKNLKVSKQFNAAPSTVRCDEARLLQVFRNILTNAVKFTPPGGEIQISTDMVSAEPPQVVITIKDTGLGLTNLELKRIFEPFTQGDHSETGKASPYGGLGLGLAISRKIAEKHAGSISATSPGRNHGASFTVHLPLTAATGVAHEALVRPTTETSPPFHHQVLLVEDHEPSRLALARLLKNRGFDVTLASSLSEALDKAAKSSFDLLISDIGLPDGTGYELMAQLKSRHVLRGVALSGYGTEADIEKSRQAGFESHLTKPVQVKQLDQVLAEIRSAQTA